MIDGDGPKSKSIGILACEPCTETGNRSHFQIVEENKRAHRSMLQCEKESVLPFRWIWRTIDQDEI